MSGYLNNPEATNEVLVNGWMHTKDLGAFDEDGYIFLTGGRTHDLIISGGENIFPQEVENVLYQHPAVAEACVFGVPDKKWGEAVVAAVSLKSTTEISENELIDFCRNKLASYKKPQRIHFLEALPKSGAGKILRKDLKNKFSKPLL
jgi:acyl-CoA synthetase (AMP-forming)/AMP-acid ligase II